MKCCVDGLIAVKDNGKWGFINTKGKEVISPIYDDANSFSYGLAAVCKDGKWGFIDTSNRLVIGYQFSGADYFNEEGFCLVRTDEPNVEDAVCWQTIELELGV